MAGMVAMPERLIVEREWRKQKWRCVGVSSAVALWLGAILAYPHVPLVVRWAQAPVFVIMTSVFFWDTLRKWRAYRGEIA
jgi:hypothetical protein